MAPPSLSLGSDQWVLFDPSCHWQPGDDGWGPQAANQPAATATPTGQVLASGLIPELRRWPVSPA